jgi:hypothetical protein
LKRTKTVEATTQEAEHVLEGKSRRRTRSQTAHADEATDGSDEKPVVRRTTTMVETTNEAAGLLGDNDLGRTRSQTADKEQEKDSDNVAPALKRTTTMAATAEVQNVMVLWMYLDVYACMSVMKPGRSCLGRRQGARLN